MKKNFCCKKISKEKAFEIFNGDKSFKLLVTLNIPEIEEEDLKVVIQSNGEDISYYLFEDECESFGDLCLTAESILENAHKFAIMS